MKTQCLPWNSGFYAEFENAGLTSSSIGDRCWRRNMLMTTLRCWSEISLFLIAAPSQMSPTYRLGRQHLEVGSKTTATKLTGYIPK